MENKTLTKEEFEEYFQQIYGDFKPQDLEPNKFNVFKGLGERTTKLFLTKTHIKTINELIRKEFEENPFPKPEPLPPNIGLGEALKYYNVTFFHKESNKWITTTREAYEKWKKSKT